MMWGAHMRKQVKLNIYERLKDKAEVQKEGHKTFANMKLFVR